MTDEPIHVYSETDMTEEPCPNCFYEYGSVTTYTLTRCRHLLCTRCGFTQDEEIDVEESAFPEIIVWNCIEKGGEGAYAAKIRNDSCTYYRPLNAEIKKKLEKAISTFVACRYTFKENGKWFIRDLIRKTTVPFTTKKMHTPETEFTGTCPECGVEGECLPIGKVKWGACHDHKLKWVVGEYSFKNVPSYLAKEFKSNSERINHYKEI
jgi:predicted RNA-binding Zn-ribbon protein involved in translation (DUF1610 family)